MPKKPGAKISPNSLANLELGRRQGHGRTLDYEQRKKKRGITVTDQGWNGLELLANQADVSVSEFLERVGRGLLTVVDSEQLEVLEKRLDLEECSRRLRNPKEVPVAYLAGASRTGAGMRIEILPGAQRDLASLPVPDRQVVDKHIQELASNPRPPDIKALSESKALLCLRVEDRRIIYRVEDERSVILIVKVSHRQNIYS